MVEKLEPPEKRAHLRGKFYWLFSPEKDLWPVLWQTEGWWVLLGDAVCQSPEYLAATGWTYSHPADPNAITLDPDDEEVVETGTRAIAALDGCTGEAEIMKGRGG